MEDIIRLQRATVDEHIRAENAHNWPAVHNTFVQDESAFYDVVPLHAHCSGLRGVKDFYHAAQNAFPDFTIDVWGEYDLPGCSIREVTLAGTHEGELSNGTLRGSATPAQSAGWWAHLVGAPRVHPHKH